MNKLPLLLLVLLTAGCGTTANYTRMVDTWMGHSATELVSAWGYPIREIKSPSGNMVYAYEHTESGVVPPIQAPQYTQTTFIAGQAISNTVGGQVFGGTTYTAWCNTYFEMDKNQTIVNWNWQGNACRN